MQRMKPRKTQSKPGARKSARAKETKDPLVVYRPRTADDDDFIVQLTESQLGQVYQVAFGEPFPREHFQRYLQSGAPTYLILQNGKRIGYYSYLIGNDGKMHITALVLDPSYQSDGIGTVVMAHVEREAAQKGVHTLEVYVQANNTKSIAFTRKLGFSEVFRPMPNTICFHKRVGGATTPQSSPPTAEPSTIGPQTQFVGYFPYHW
jgi:ribosomal protein S18 acetylase RimI-like enzyme